MNETFKDVRPLKSQIGDMEFLVEESDEEDQRSKSDDEVRSLSNDFVQPTFRIEEEKITDETNEERARKTYQDPFAKNRLKKEEQQLTNNSNGQITFERNNSQPMNLNIKDQMTLSNYKEKYRQQRQTSDNNHKKEQLEEFKKLCRQIGIGEDKVTTDKMLKALHKCNWDKMQSLDIILQEQQEEEKSDKSSSEESDSDDDLKVSERSRLQQQNAYLKAKLESQEQENKRLTNKNKMLQLQVTQLSQMKDQQYEILQSNINKDHKNQKIIRVEYEELQAKYNQLISQVQGFVLDDQQQKIKQVLSGATQAYNQDSLESSGSSMLFLHYSDKLNELTQVIKSGFQYLGECKKQVVQIDDCLICGDNFEDMENIPVHDRELLDMLSTKKTKFKLECGHTQFHEGCILKWLRVKPQCPLCNKKIDDIPFQ